MSHCHHAVSKFNTSTYSVKELYLLLNNETQKKALTQLDPFCNKDPSLMCNKHTCIPKIDALLDLVLDFLFSALLFLHPCIEYGCHRNYAYITVFELDTHCSKQSLHKRLLKHILLHTLVYLLCILLMFWCYLLVH